MLKTSDKINNGTAIDVKYLTVAYGEKTVVKNISFAIPKGSVVSMIGPNGSGKTTLIKTLLGLIKPSSGHVEILGQSVGSIREKIAYIPQKFEFDRQFPITVMEFMKLTAGKRTQESDILDNISHIKLDPGVLNKKLGTLSGGQLQRVLIAQAMLNDPEILFLDEPSAGIDVVGEQTFYDILQHLNEDHGTTILMVSHDISNVLKNVDMVLCINTELLCYGTPKEVLDHADFGKLFDPNSKALSHSDHRL